MKYRVVSDTSRVIDYLGTFEEGVEQEFTEEQAKAFQTFRGVPLLQGNVPAGVQVTIVVGDEEKDDTEKVGE